MHISNFLLFVFFRKIIQEKKIIPIYTLHTNPLGFAPSIVFGPDPDDPHIRTLPSSPLLPLFASNPRVNRRSRFADYSFRFPTLFSGHAFLVSTGTCMFTCRFNFWRRIDNYGRFGRWRWIPRAIPWIWSPCVLRSGKTFEF